MHYWTARLYETLHSVDVLVLISSFPQEDRVIIVGCTSKPDAGDAKDFKNFFQKFLYFPAPDYASRLMLWHHFIRQRLEQVKHLTLAHRAVSSFSENKKKLRRQWDGKEAYYSDHLNPLERVTLWCRIRVTQIPVTSHTHWLPPPPNP